METFARQEKKQKRGLERDSKRCSNQELNQLFLATYKGNLPKGIFNLIQWIKASFHPKRKNQIGTNLMAVTPNNFRLKIIQSLVETSAVYPKSAVVSSKTQTTPVDLE